ncbi:MAG: hypothetical protein ACR5LA_08590 [Wolbachia sp.]
MFIDNSANSKPISPVLANLTLDSLDDVFNKHFGKKGTRKHKKYGIVHPFV